MKVSVIVPMYNVENYIRETIASLQDQTLTEVEYILVDDGSTDTTHQVVESLTQDDPRFRLIKRENHGPAASRNFSLTLVTGDYICFLDSDDLLGKESLSIMYNAAINQQADLVTGNILRFNSTRTWRVKAYEHRGVTRPGVKTLADNPELLIAMGAPGKLYKRELIEGLIFAEDLRLGEDQSFVAHALSRAKKIVTVGEDVYLYRSREDETQSLTQRALTNSAEALEYLYSMVEQVRPALPDKVLWAYYLSRVVTLDMWPRLRAAIRTRDEEVQTQVLTSFHHWISPMSAESFHPAFDIHAHLLAGLLVNLRYVKSTARPAALGLLKVLSHQAPLTSKLRVPVVILHTTIVGLVRMLSRQKPTRDSS